MTTFSIPDEVHVSQAYVSIALSDTVLCGMGGLGQSDTIYGSDNAWCWDNASRAFSTPTVYDSTGQADPSALPPVSSPASLSLTLPASYTTGSVGGERVRGAVVHGGVPDCDMTDQLCYGGTIYSTTYLIRCSTEAGVYGLTVIPIASDGPALFGGGVAYDYAMDQLVLYGGYQPRNSYFYRLVDPFGASPSWELLNRVTATRSLASTLCIDPSLYPDVYSGVTSPSGCLSVAGTSGQPGSTKYVTVYNRRYTAVYSLSCTEEEGEGECTFAELGEIEPPMPGQTHTVVSSDGKSMYTMGGWYPFYRSVYVYTFGSDDESDNGNWECLSNCPDYTLRDTNSRPNGHLRPMMVTYDGYLYLFECYDTEDDEGTTLYHSHLLRREEQAYSSGQREQVDWELYQTFAADSETVPDFFVTDGTPVEVMLDSDGEGAFILYGNASSDLWKYRVGDRTMESLGNSSTSSVWPGQRAEGSLAVFPFGSRLAPTDHDTPYVNYHIPDAEDQRVSTLIYLTGGYDDTGCMSDLWVYDIAAGEWTQNTSVDVPLFCFTRGVVWEDKWLWVNGRTSNLGESIGETVRPNMMWYDFLSGTFHAQDLFSLGQHSLTVPGLRYDHGIIPIPPTEVDTAEAHETDAVALLYGGISKDGRFYSDVWSVNGLATGILSHSSK
ncbi:hypothetical protein KIPB_010100, partial [Kipferlia bialata]|eukprot:g10100.t1